MTGLKEKCKRIRAAQGLDKVSTEYPDQEQSIAIYPTSS